MPYTEEQKLLIHHLKDKNLLVSAAAGSGKTMVLVERILHLITAHEIDIHRLLVVTFTKKAAAEMRERIQRSLEEKLKEREGEASFLRRQLQLLSGSSIKTLHSFCLDIIRDNFHLLDLDPTSRIGESSEMSLLALEALGELLEDCYQRDDPSLSLLLDSYGTKRGDGKIREMILTTYRFMHSHPHPFLWLKKAVDLYDVNNGRFDNHCWVETMKDQFRSQLKASAIFLERACELCQEPHAPYEYLEALEKDASAQKELAFLLEEGLDSFLGQARELTFPRLKSIRGKRKEEVDPRLVEEIKDLRDSYKKEIEKIKKSIYWESMEEISKALSHLHKVLEALSSLIHGFHRTYKEKKMAGGLLDYGDLEHMALEILENQDVRASLKEKYHYIFIDEYQDSSPVQEKILHQIKREKNLFMVGDVRQSIYRFRLADPSIFMDKYRSFSKYEDAPHAIDIRVDLQKNFRSREEVLGAVNLLFSYLMSPDLGEMEYSKEAYLNKGLTFPWLGDGSPRLVLLEEGEDEEIEEEIQDLSRAEVEAHFIAEAIKDLLGKEISLPKEDGPRRIEYRDIVILLRSPYGRAEIYEEVFYQEGIPLQVDKGAGLFSSYEVLVMLNLLRIIDNHQQDLSLLSVLHSPIGGFTPRDLTTIRLERPEGSFYLALREYATKEDELAKKASSFLEKLSTWAKEASSYRVSDFIWRLLLESGLYFQAGIRPGGEKRQANLRLLVDKASEWEKGRAPHLFAFLLFIDSLSQEGELSAPAFSGSEKNVVHLFSVHKSKGLEFPIVFIGDLGCQFNLQDLKGDLLLHKSLGIGLPYIDDKRRIARRSLAQLAIKEKKRRESLSEELRILYVALTRAMDRLILVGSAKNLSSLCRKWVLGAEPCQLLRSSSFLDWIGSVLAMYKGGEPIRELAGVTKEVEAEDPPWRVDIVSLKDMKVERAPKTRGEREALFALTSIAKEVEERLDWKYMYEEATSLPSKISVTEVLEQRQRAKAGHLPSLQRGERDGLLRGLVMHKAMRSIPLVDPLDIDEAIEEMVERGALEREEVDLLDREGIDMFFKSSLGQRMIGSPKVYREVPFVLKKKASLLLPQIKDRGEEILVQGIIDAFFIEEGKMVLVDYKTDRVDGRTLVWAKRRYALQMKLYREALLASDLEVKETYLYFFHYGAVRV